MKIKLAGPNNYIVLDSSLDYLFSNFKQDGQIQIIDMSNGPINAQTFTQVQNYTKQAKNRCIFISSHQNPAKMRRIFGTTANIISIETESWELEEKADQILPNMMQEYINLIEKCL